MVSVRLGARETCGEPAEGCERCGRFHRRPRGKREIPGRSAWHFAHGKALRGTKKQQRQLGLRDEAAVAALSSKIPHDSGEKFYGKQKSPTRRPGASGLALSREGRGPLRRGRVAWLTAVRADYSGGTAADLHGLPRIPGCQLKIQCKPQGSEVSMEVWK